MVDKIIIVPLVVFKRQQEYDRNYFRPFSDKTTNRYWDSSYSLMRSHREISLQCSLQFCFVTWYIRLVRSFVGDVVYEGVGGKNTTSVNLSKKIVIISWSESDNLLGCGQVALCDI